MQWEQRTTGKKQQAGISQQAAGSSHHIVDKCCPCFSVFFGAAAPLIRSFGNSANPVVELARIWSVTNGATPSSIATPCFASQIIEFGDHMETGDTDYSVPTTAHFF